MAVRPVNVLLLALVLLVTTASGHRHLTRDRNKGTTAGLTEDQCKASGAGQASGIAANACAATTVRQCLLGCCLLACLLGPTLLAHCEAAASSYQQNTAMQKWECHSEHVFQSC